MALVSIQGDFYRAVPEPAEDFGLEDGPSFASFNRYNLAQKFGALYFGDRPEVCRATVLSRGHLLGRSLPHALLTFEIDLGKAILDMTDLDVQKRLGIASSQLVQSQEIPGAYETPNHLAHAAYLSGRIKGLLVPDATATGNTLVLYPARVLVGDSIRLKNRSVF